MKLYSYVVRFDFGFAPNPFFGVCTLATCKPLVRKKARVGDWVVGTGSKRYALEGRLAYAMVVGELLTFDEYWNDPRFQKKKPNLRGSIKQAYGDNIYHRNPKNNRWIQEDSHHSLPDGRPNLENIRHDTKADRVLVGSQFAYWGAIGPLIPSRFRKSGGINVCAGRGHKCRFSEEFVDSFVSWVKSLSLKGYLGPPSEFR